MKDRDIFEAIAEGVDRAIFRMITGITQMPSADFWDILEKSIKNAFERAANEITEELARSKRKS
jgi:hypothetical protein